MSLLSSIFGKTATQSQNNKSSRNTRTQRTDRSAARRSAVLMDSVGRFEVSE